MEQNIPTEKVWTFPDFNKIWETNKEKSAAPAYEPIEKWVK